MMKLEKVELTASVTHIEKFSDSEIPILILKSQTQLEEKQRKGEEEGKKKHRQLQSVKSFTQTEKSIRLKKIFYATYF